MNKERLNLLENYIKTGVAPLLIENIPSDLFSNSVVLKSNIDKSELNGHYEDIEFCPPTWYKELLEKSKLDYVILVIENINDISIEEQNKFIEILKYNKISTFTLPKNCLIIVTCSNLNNKKISEEVYSLLAQI
ncbi:hypothetical protein EGP98_00510 [bacterium]|nr:hypothetical protein [bacterium]